MNLSNRLTAAAFLVASLIAAAGAQTTGNPPYTIDRSVVSAGGGTSTDATSVYKIEGVIGQPVAGKTSTSSPFSVRSGFFTPAPFGPTAAPVDVGGRILTSEGQGIRNVIVTMTGGNGILRTTISSSFGYFNFEDVPAGDVYILSVSAKRYQFGQNIQVVSVSDNISDISFIADPQ